METNITDKGYFSSAVLTLQTEGKSTKLKKEKMLNMETYIKHLYMKMDFLHCKKASQNVY